MTAEQVAKRWNQVTGAALAECGAGIGAPVRAQVLGGFALSVHGRLLTRGDWVRTSAERLVKLLLVTRGHRLRRERAAEALWPEVGTESSCRSLRKAIHFARRALGGCNALNADAQCVWLDPLAIEVDLDELVDALDALAGGLRVDRAARIAATDIVLSLGVHELLPDDVYEDWLAAPRERLRSRWQMAALDAACRDRDEGDLHRAHALVAQLLECDPADEATHRLAIQLYVAEGRLGCAQQQMATCRAVLRETFSIEPSPETEAALHLTGNGWDRAAAVTERDEQDGQATRCRAHRDRGPLLRPVTAIMLRGPDGKRSRPPDAVLRAALGAGWQVLGWRSLEPPNSLIRAGAGSPTAPAVGRAAAS